MMIVFYVAEYGLQTQLDEVLTEEEFHSTPTDQFLPNRNWYSVAVSNKEDMKKWVEAKNAWLNCAWTPNQTRTEQQENKEDMKRLERVLEPLVTEVSK
jgi:hypothetical protein